MFGKFSNKYENKLDNIWETTEKESSHLDLYLKSYSQSKFQSNSVFKIKQKKKTFQIRIRFRAEETYFGRLRFHLEHAGRLRVTDSGSRGATGQV